MTQGRQHHAHLFELCSEMPCIPALFFTADSVLRSVIDIIRKDAPLCASSRKRLTSSRDHKLVTLDWRLAKDGIKHLSARIVTLTSWKHSHRHCCAWIVAVSKIKQQKSELKLAR